MSKCPVELFAGVGLGVSHSTLGVVQSIIPSTAIGQAQILCRVNLFNGNLFITDHVCAVAESNGPLNFAFYYNSQTENNNAFWRFSLDKQIVPVVNPANAQQMTLRQADGHESIYVKDPNSNYFLGPKDANGRGMLRFDEIRAEWVHYHTGTEQVEIYDQQYGLRSSVADAIGRTTRFQYNANQKLEAVVGPSLARYEMRWGANQNGSALQIVEVKDGLEITLQIYQFDSFGRLSWSQTSENGYLINYGYLDESSYLRSIRQSDGTDIQFELVENRLDTIELTNPQETNKLRYGVKYPASLNDPVIFEDSNKIPTKVTLNALGQINQVSRLRGDTPADQAVDNTIYVFVDQQLAVTTLPDNSQHLLGYDPYYGFITSETLPDLQYIEYHFEQNTDRPKKLTEVHWLVRNVTPLVTRFVYDNNWDERNLQHSFLRFKISPGGAVSENRPDAFGNVESRRDYTGERFIKVFDPSLSPALKQMKDWVKALKNQTQIGLQDFLYDSRGQVQQATTYTEINPDGTGKISDSNTTIVHYWNRFGSWTERRLSKSTGLIVKSVREYNDSLQRMTREIDALNNSTIMTYTDASQQQSIEYANRQTKSNTFNALQTSTLEIRKALSQGKIQERSTQIIRDFGGRPIKTWQIDKKFTYQFFDQQQRPRFLISRTGIVSETQYHSDKNYHCTIDYAQIVNISDLYISKNPEFKDLPSLQRLLKAVESFKDNPKNRVAYVFYNQNEHPRYEIDANKFLIETQYDNLGRPVATIHYAQKLTDAQLLILTSGQQLVLPTPDFTQDRVTQIYYDQDSNPTLSVDPAGYVSLNMYDAANRVIKTTHFHKPLSTGRNLNSLVLPTIQTDDQKDASTYYVRNAAGQVVYQVDPESCVTFNTYFASGKLAKSQHFVNKVDPTWYADTTQPPIVSPTSEDEIIEYEYDDLLRQIKATNNNGRVNYQSYDEMGNLTLDGILDKRNPNSLNSNDQRRTQSQFDAWNQTTATANPFVSQYMLENPMKTPSIWEKECLRDKIDETGLKLLSTDPLGHVTRYLYDDERRPIITIDPRGAITEVTLNIFGESEGARKYNQRIPQDKLDTIEGGVITPALREYVNSLRDDVLDIVSSNNRNNLGLIEDSTDSEGNSSLFTYNAFRQIHTELLPVNTSSPTLSITHQYDPRGLETETLKEADAKKIIEKKQYQHYLGKLTAQTNGLNHTQSTEYDRNGLLKKVFDAFNRITQTIERDGLRRIKQETNGYLQSIQHSYQHTMRTEVITYPEQDTTKLLTRSVLNLVVTSGNFYSQSKLWGYCPDGREAFFQAGDQSPNQNKFDLTGQLDQSRDHNQTLTKFDRDDAGNVWQQTIAVGQSDQRITVLENNAFNRVVTSTKKNPTDIVTATVYYKTGPVKTQTIDVGDKSQHLNLLTTNTINAQAQLSVQAKGCVGNPDQWNQVIGYDGFGRKTSTTIDPQGLNITTRDELNAIGKSTKSTDANGNQTLHFYDDNELERFTIFADGSVNQVQYDIMGRVSKEQTFATRLTSAEVSTLQTTRDCEQLMASKATPDDSLVWKFYNATGTLRFIVNAVGSVKEDRYDKAQRCKAHYQYSKQLTDLSILDHITTQELVTLMASYADTLHDRVNYTIYNAADQQAYTIDAAGYITAHFFDGENNEIITTKYATRLDNPSATAELPVEKVANDITVNSNRDQTTYNVFNHHNQMVFSVTGELEVTQYQYDTVGNRTNTIRRWNKVSSPNDYLDLVAKLNLLPPDAKDRNVTKVYDNANRVKQTIDAMTNTDTFTLTDLGDIEYHTDPAGNVWRFSIDRARRVTDEISPVVPINIITMQLVDGKNQLVATESMVSLTTHYGLDNNGNQQSMTTGYGASFQESFTQKFNIVNKMTGTRMEGVLIDNGSKVATFTNRPEVKVTLESYKIYDSKGREVIEQGQNGAYIFHVRDAAGNERFVVNNDGGVVELKRNAFGEAEEKIEYYNKLTLDLKQYTQNGIPIADIQTVKSNLDRHTILTRDQRGDVILTQRGPTIVYNLIGPNREDRHIVNNSYCQTEVEYDAFRKPIRQRECVDPMVNTWTEKLVWYDRDSRAVACAFKFSLQSIYYLQLWQHNSFDEEVGDQQYKARIAAELDANKTTITQLIALAAANRSTDGSDRFMKKDYNPCGKQLSETRLNVKRHRLVIGSDKKAGTVAIVGDVTKSTEYNELQLPSIITYEDGSIEKIFYDARGKERARTGIMRTTTVSTLQVTLFPLKKTGWSPQGGEVLTIEYANGAVSQDDPTAKLADSNIDHQIVKLRDSRGLVLVEQDPEYNLIGFTYNTNKKLVRKFQPLTNVDVTTLALEPHIDQSLYQLNQLDQVTGMELIRDGQTQFNWINVLNTFGEVIKEGDMIRQFDNLGRVWLQNQKGIATIYAFNGLGNQTLIMQSAARDLTLVKPEDYFALLNDLAVDLERTEMIQDLQGNTIETFDPLSTNAPVDKRVSSENSEDNGDLIPLAPVFNKQYPGLFDEECLTWIFPQERLVQAEFEMWPSQNPLDIISKDIKIFGVTRAGVDVSTLDADLYCYRIKYTIEIPNVMTQQLYHTCGQVQVDTPKVNNSLSLVAIVEDGNQIRLTGNTKNLVQVELLSSSQIVATLPVTQNRVDLSRYQSGIYQLRGVRTTGPDTDPTLHFTIFTAQLPNTPLAREISCKITLNASADFGQLLLSLPSTYLAAPIKITCDYVDDSQNKQSDDVLINDVRFFNFEGPDGFASNFKFSHSVKSITSISLSVTDTMNQWLLIVDKAEPFIASKRKSAAVELPHHQISTTVNTVCSLPKNFDSKIAKSSNPETVISAFFSVRQVIHIVAWPNIPSSADLVVEYKDMSFDRLAEWRGMQIIASTQNSITLDVTAMQPCQYPFRVEGFPQQDGCVFNVSGGGQVYPCTGFLNTALTKDYYVLLAKLAPYHVSSQFTGTLPSGQRLTFDEFLVRPDIDSGFTALGIHSHGGRHFRDIFADFLVDRIKTVPNTGLKLHDEIFSALLRKEVLPLHRDLWDNLAVAANEQQMRLYARVPAMVNHYINQYRSSMKLGFHSALVYAEYYNITIHLWRRNANSHLLEYLLGYDAKEKATNSIHMLITDGCTGFNLLVDQSHKPNYHSSLLQTVLQNRLKILDNTRRHRTASFDRWGNAVQRGDAYATPNKPETYKDFVYDDQNRGISQVLPILSVMDEHGVATSQRPETIISYNLRGFRIFEKDPNQNTTGFILNEACQLTQIVDGAGLVVSTQVLDIFGDSVQFSTAYGATWVNTFDRNRRSTRSMQPDQLNIVNEFNEKGQLRKQTSTGNKVTYYNLGVNDDITARVDPGLKATLIAYDRNHQKFSLKFPPPYIVRRGTSNGMLSWERDYFGNETSHTNLSGMKYITVPDFKKQPTRRYQQPYSLPNPQDQIQMLSKYMASAFGLGLLIFIQKLFKQNPVKLQDLSYKWDAGRLIEVSDATNSVDEFYGYDDNNRRVALTVKKHDGTLIQSVETRYDSRGAVFYVHDGMCISFTFFDPKGNRRNVLTELFYSGKKTPDMTSDLWYTYNDDDTVSIGGGQLNQESKKIEIALNQGIHYGYDKGQRKTQTYMGGPYTRGITVNIGYYNSGLVQFTRGQGIQLSTSHVYDNDYRETSYVQNNPPGIKVRSLSATTTFDDTTGFMKKNDTTQLQPLDDTKKVHSVTVFPDWNGSGQPTSQFITNTYSGEDTTTVQDNLSVQFVGADDWKTAAVSGVRTLIDDKDDQTSDIAVASTIWDSNWNVISQTGLVDPDNKDSDTVSSNSYYYTTAPTGHPIDKTAVKSGADPFFGFSSNGLKSRYFIDANTNILGMYEFGLNNLNSKIPYFGAVAPYVKHSGEYGRSHEMGFDPGRGGWVTQKDFSQLTVLDPVQPIGLLWMSRRGYMLNGRYGEDISSSLQGSMAWQHSSEYILTPGDDSFAAISARLFDGDPSYATLIAAYNGRMSSQDILVTDQKIRVPMFLPAHNNYQINMNYIKLMSIIVEHLYPALKTPQPETNWFEVLVLTIAIVVAAIVVPEIVGMMAPALVAALGGEIVVSVVVGAAVAGVIDAAGQGLLIGFGLEDRFSWDDVMEAAIGGGLAGGMGAGLFNPGTSSDIFNAVIQKGMANITHQLIEMSLGKQTAFDFKSLVATAATAAFNSKVNFSDAKGSAAYPEFSKAVGMAFTDVTNTFITSVITQQTPDIRTTSAQMLGNQVGNYAGVRMAEYIHNNYTTSEHQAKYYFDKGHDNLRPIPIQQRVAIPAPVASKISQKRTEAQTDKTSQRLSAHSKNIKELNETLNSDSIDAHEAVQLNTKMLMKLYQQGEKTAQSIFHSSQWEQTSDILLLSRFSLFPMSSSDQLAAPTPTAYEKIKLQAYMLLKRINDSPITQKLANNPITDTLVNQSMRINRRGAPSLNDLAGAGKELANETLQFWDFITGYSGMAPQFTITTGQDRGAALMQTVLIFNVVKDMAMISARASYQEMNSLSQAQIRANVEANIAESQAARASSGFLKYANKEEMRANIKANIAENRAAMEASGFYDFANRSTALEFYLQKGYSYNITLAEIRGIDFAQPVDIMTIRAGTGLDQFHLPNWQGSYYAETGAIPDKLGIYTSGRARDTFFAKQDVTVLKSTTAPMIFPETIEVAKTGEKLLWQVETRGGATQYFSPDKHLWELHP